MKSLFVIGNGFDLAHGLKTSYEDFHQYLIENYPDASLNRYGHAAPEAIMMPDGGMSYDEDDVVGFLIEVVSNAEPKEKWSDLETSIGYLELDNYFPNWDFEQDNEWHAASSNEVQSSDIAGAVLKITEYFSEWIDTIELNEVNPLPNFQRLIDVQNDSVLTFNYTETLQEVYGAINVCHIHGRQGEKLYFGHGNDTDYTEDFMSSNVGSESHLQDMQDRLRKNTREALARNEDFFIELTDEVDKIYSFGFSFSSVDEIYIREICKRLRTEKATWFLNDFDDSDTREQYIKTIRANGFKGEFATYKS